MCCSIAKHGINMPITVKHWLATSVIHSRQASGAIPINMQKTGYLRAYFAKSKGDVDLTETRHR